MFTTRSMPFVAEAVVAELDSVPVAREPVPPSSPQPPKRDQHDGKGEG